MLTEKRQEEILKLLEGNGSVTVQELTDKFGASESTIRRDLNTLHNRGVLVKVFGGAIKNEMKMQVKEEEVARRIEYNKAEKERIAKFAASLIVPGDFVYLDAGTTTGAMIPYLEQQDVTYVTNAVSHGLQLAEKGHHVILIGGELKAITEAIVGNEAYHNLQKFNFTKGFFGTNGADIKAGFTTPDMNESLIKECAMKHTREIYVLCDSQKFHQICPICFAKFEEAVVITDALPDASYEKYTNIEVV